MHYHLSTDINAPLERIWAVLTDVEKMPEWTSSMTRVQRLEEGPLAVGSTVRVKQPRLPTAVWRVEELAPMRSFSWTTTSGGVTTTAGHVLVADRGSPPVTVTFDIQQQGLLAPLAGLFTARLTRRYVQTELAGLEQRSQTLSP